jgi:hypothetical protein
MSFKLTLHFSRLAEELEIADPALISDKRLGQAWQLLTDFVIDMIDELGEEPTDERFRELYLEICYRLIYREMTALRYLPGWEKLWKHNLETGKRGPRVEGGTYGHKH